MVLATLAIECSVCIAEHFLPSSCSLVLIHFVKHLLIVEYYTYYLSILCAVGLKTKRIEVSKAYVFWNGSHTWNTGLN